MGFMQRNFGIIRDCWVENGVLYYETPYTKAVYSHKTDIQGNIPRQNNDFRSNTVAFLLKNNGFTYVGRYDGTISVLDETSELLLDILHWEPPGHVPVCKIGKLNSAIGFVSAYLDLRDRHTVYADYCRAEGHFPYEMGIIVPECELIAYYNGRPSVWQWMIVDSERGELLVEHWSLQKNVWSGDCRCFF